jgi:small subunit ribosomal protein S1
VIENQGTEEQVIEDQAQETEPAKEETMADFEEFWSKSLNTAEVGKIYKGSIVRIDGKDVYLDIQAKNEGVVPLNEFARDKLPPTLGQEIDVMVVQNLDDSTLILSKSKAETSRAWETASDAFDKGERVMARIHSKVKGGLNGDCQGLKAFIPGSLMSLHQEYDLEKYIGQEFEFNIIEFNRRRRNMVLSRREILQEERRRNIEHIFQTLKEGDVCEGVVKNITDYGAFVSILDGQIDGLLHKADMSWAHVRSVASVVKLGDQIQVKILNIDRSREKISLGIKQLTDDPWSSIESRFVVGSRQTGVIKNITHFGAFVELAEGVEGLVHVSDISWTQRIKHPEESLKIGEEIEVKVLNYEKDSRKISLGIKQTQEDPWEKVFDEFNVDQIIKGFIRNVTDFGAFVEIQDGIQGLVHISDLSWSNKVTHPKQLVQMDQEIEVKIISMDRENRKISLSMKEVTQDPWTNVTEKFPVGTVTEGTVTGLTNFGAFVEIAENVEGMIHISDFSWTEHYDNAENFLKVDQKIECKVLEVEPQSRKISLGIKQLTEEPWFQVIKEYPVGTTITGKVSNLTNFGAFIEISNGVDGLLHVSDMSWTEKIDHPSDRLSEGDSISVKVLNIDMSSRKISLGLKQVSDDPLDQFLSQTPLKSIIQAKVKEVSSDGDCTLELAEKVIGFVPARNMGAEVRDGDEVNAKVMEFDTDKKQIILSIKAAEKQLERSACAEYNKNNDAKSDQTSAQSLEQLASLKAEILQEEAERSTVKQPKKAAAKKTTAKKAKPVDKAKEEAVEVVKPSEETTEPVVVAEKEDSAEV